MNEKSPGKLYMIPCPIGDTPVWSVLPASNRAVMESVDYYIVENLRSARRFLSKAAIGKPIDSLEFATLDEHTPAQDIEELIAPILAGRDAGMISEAGMPGVADPGAELAGLCHRKGIRVVPLVGPSSILLALMASGLNGQSFAFNGYLPVKDEQRTKAIRAHEKIAAERRQSQIFIEAPYRNLRLFDALLSVCRPQTMLCVACDILEPAELIRTRTIAEWRKGPKPDINKRPAIFIIL